MRGTRARAEPLSGKAENVPALCQSCEARHRGICGALDAAQLQFLSTHTSKTVVEAGHEIPVSISNGHRYANILSGVVKLSKLMSDGRQQIVGLQFAPDFLGRPFSQDASISTEAVANVRLCSFTSDVLDTLIAESPALEHRLHEQALKELDEAREWMLTLGRKTASEKVASFLALIAANIDPESYASSGKVSFEIPLKRADIADFLGLTTETVSRQITNLRKQGILSVENSREVTVLDMDALHDASGS